MTEFSSSAGLPPTRYSPAAGQIGQQAAMRGAKSASHQAAPGSSRGGGTTSPGPRPTAKGGGRTAPAPQPEPETSDFRHAIAAAQYENMRRLGRDIPFGNWLLLNGHYRELLPDHGRPFDLFLDTP